MNQEQIKTLLLRLNTDVPDFKVILTGKKSLKVHGLYKPDSQEIILHNKNFTSEPEMIYTAIHEFAHHVHFSSEQRPTSQRSHNTHFWDLFHRLLRKAEDLGIYQNIFLSEPDFISLTEKIKNEYLKENGHLMKEFGQLLMQASELCQKHHARFEDYMDRILCISRSTARTLMQSYSKDIDPTVGFDQMKTLVTVKDPHFRQELERKIQSGFSPEMIRQEIKSSSSQPTNLKVNSASNLNQLLMNREVIKKKIENLQNELAKLELTIKQNQEGSL